MKYNWLYFFLRLEKKFLFCQQCNFGIGTYCIGSLIKQKRIYQNDKIVMIVHCALFVIKHHSCRVCCSGQHTGRILQRMLEKKLKHLSNMVKKFEEIIFERVQTSCSDLKFI